MKACRGVWFLAGLLTAPPALDAQTTIIISDSLAAHAERLNVKKGAQWIGQIARWRVGDYAVVSSRGGWTTARTTGNLFDRETESASTERFSFVFANNTTDSATVNAARHVTVQSLRKLELGNGWSLGSDELVQEADNFIAVLTLNRDTTETWALFMGVTKGDTTVGHYEAFLTDGTRRIVLAAASSNKNVYDLGGPPALGYEFVENGQSLAALQYFGGSASRAPIVWIHRSLDARMKLILAAAMTAVLQVKSL
jgi:hypothetical protein